MGFCLGDSRPWRQSRGWGQENCRALHDSLGAALRGANRTVCEGWAEEGTLPAWTVATLVDIFSVGRKGGGKGRAPVTQ